MEQQQENGTAEGAASSQPHELHYQEEQEEDETEEMPFHNEFFFDYGDLSKKAPFCVTPPHLAQLFVTLAGVTKEDLVVDLGCGEGDVLNQCALATGCKALGLDIKEKLVNTATQRAKELGLDVETNVRYRVSDFIRDTSWIDEATKVYIWTVPAQMEDPALQQALAAFVQRKPGNVLVSRNLPVPGLTHVHCEKPAYYFVYCHPLSCASPSVHTFSLTPLSSAPDHKLG
ncbi:Class I SAM-dependent methyltransferase [Balamuthia mandrillaris]